jgi:hypothetical protein
MAAICPAARAVLKRCYQENAMDTMTTSYLIPVYATYATVSVGLTVWLARTLFKNGAVFLEEVFANEPRMAESVNRLLVVGFYLINLGYAALLLKAGSSSSAVEAVEVLSYKLGLLLLSLGGMHFANLFVFHRIRRRVKIAVLPPPVAPQMHVLPERKAKQYNGAADHQDEAQV